MVFSNLQAVVIREDNERTKRRTAPPSKEPPSGVSGSTHPPPPHNVGRGSLLPHSPKCLEGKFREVRLLINSPKFAQGCSWWHHVYRWKGSARIRQAGRKGERYALYAVLPHPHGRGERGG